MREKRESERKGGIAKVEEEERTGGEMMILHLVP